MDIPINIQNKKLELIKWLTSLDDLEIINKIFAVKENTTGDWWDEISDAEREGIEKGLQDAKDGKFVSQDEVRKLYEKYL